VEDHFSGLETQRVVFEKLEKVTLRRCLALFQEVPREENFLEASFFTQICRKVGWYRSIRSLSSAVSENRPGT
jgi:hypothetical protein